MRVVGWIVRTIIVVSALFALMIMWTAYEANQGGAVAMMIAALVFFVWIWRKI